MAKMFSLTKIEKADPRNPDGPPILILERKVFDATPTEAKQFDALKAARPATDEEIAAAKAEAAIADGSAFQTADTSASSGESKPKAS